MVRILRRFGPGLLVACISVVALETALQLCSSIRPWAVNQLLYRVIQLSSPGGDRFWKDHFLLQLQDPGPGLAGKDLFMPNPLLGWSLRPGIKVASQGYFYTINRDGARSLHDYSRDRKKYSVLIVGDSFAFGEELGDDFAWPTLLERKDSRLAVLNFGVPGYGTDQMLLMLKEVIPRYRPDLVIFAFIWDDFDRSLLEFREFKKPYFKLSGGNLELQNTPVGGVEEVARATRLELKTTFFSACKTCNVFRNLVKGRGRPDREFSRELNRAILKEGAKAAKESGAEFWLVHLEATPDPVTPEISSLPAELAADGTAAYFDLAPAFKEEPRRFAPGHYHPVEATVVSDFLYSKLKPKLALKAPGKGDPGTEAASR